MQENREELPYRIGALLYMPAFQKNIVSKVLHGNIPCLTSIAFCLEDTVREEALDDAEQSLHAILRKLVTVQQEKAELPLVFVRVRTPEHFQHILRLYEDVRPIITGFVLPKFDLTNADAYLRTVKEENCAGRRTYIMPTLESSMIANCDTRHAVLHELYNKLFEVHDDVLNVRVGGNDFSNLYGLRRPASATIYDVGIVRDILVDILNVFAKDYVVSGPVWNYFGKPGDASWEAGLERELTLDRINGFVGKTAIHPCQLPLIYENLQVTREDYEDACRLADWSPAQLGVQKGVGGHRMNEVNCHSRWARRILALAQIYGIREEAGGAEREHMV